MPYICRYCGESFCADHRLPENHECKRLPPPRWSPPRDLPIRMPPPKPPQVVGAIREVRRQDGTIVDFDKRKITYTIFRAVRDRRTAEELSDEVVELLEQKYAGKIPTLNDIYYVVKKVLAEYQKQYKVSKPWGSLPSYRISFRLSSSFKKLLYNIGLFSILSGFVILLMSIIGLAGVLCIITGVIIDIVVVLRKKRFISNLSLGGALIFFPGFFMFTNVFFASSIWFSPTATEFWGYLGWGLTSSLIGVLLMVIGGAMLSLAITRWLGREIFR